MPRFIRLTLVLTAAFAALLLALVVVKVVVTIALIAAFALGALYVLNFVRAFIRSRRATHSLVVVDR